MTAEDIKNIASGLGKHAWEAGPKHGAVTAALAAGRGNLPGMFLAEGLWLNGRALASGGAFRDLFVCPALIYTDEWAKTAAALMGRSENIYIVSEKVCDKLCAEKADRGLASIISLPQWGFGDIGEGETGTLLVLDGLENPGNVGTLIRTADGAGADAVILCNRRTGLNNPQTVRASLCTLLMMPVFEADAADVMAFIDRRGYTVYVGKAGAARNYAEVSYDRRSVLVVGHEKYGVSAPWFARSHVGVSIPMRGRVDSLNVAVAGGILLYEAMKGRG